MVIQGVSDKSVRTTGSSLSSGIIHRRDSHSCLKYKNVAVVSATSGSLSRNCFNSHISDPVSFFVVPVSKVGVELVLCIVKCNGLCFKFFPLY